MNFTHFKYFLFHIMNMATKKEDDSFICTIEYLPQPGPYSELLKTPSQ